MKYQTLISIVIALPVLFLAAPADMIFASDFTPLIGRWQRPDGGYTLEIRRVDSEVRMGTGYFNPRPINVSMAQAQEKVEFSSYKDLIELFDKLGYTTETWDAGLREIPRVYLVSVPSRWRNKTSKEVEVVMKKEIFFRIMAPLLLRAKETILTDRNRLLSLSDGRTPDKKEAWLGKLALRYKVVDSVEAKLSAKQFVELRKRVDAIPPSLAMAQAAEESGWGTARFADLGNALFGQWTWGGKGITPKEQRKGKGNYKIASFGTIQESVDGYMFNLNTSPAYINLRQRRAELRQQNKPVTGLALAETLDRYSERGVKYVKSLKTLIKSNKLGQIDEISFSDKPVILLMPVGTGKN